jgi:hypothetical protein
VKIEIDPRTVPELAAILRTPGMLAKVRLLDVVCERDSRLVEVLRVAKRPFALGIDTTMIHGFDTAAKWYWFYSNQQNQWAMNRRGRWLGLWLDEPDREVATVNGPRLHNRFTFTCAKDHCSKEITLPWLREQLESGKKRTVITDAMQ